MSRKKGNRIDLGGGDGLTHSPFASLRGTSGAHAGVPGSGEDPPPAPEVGPGSDAPAAGRIEVRRERKGRGGKTVTVLRWLGSPPAEDERRSLARELASALGAGARAEGPDAIVVQGDQVDRTIDALAARGRPERIVRGTERR